jgi:hypothetical protein
MAVISKIVCWSDFFNDLLSSLRSKVENTTGMWKSRFSFLQMHIRSNHDVNLIARMVKFSAVLHNFIFLSSW